MLEPDIRLYVQLLPEENQGLPGLLDHQLPLEAYLVEDELHLEFDVPGVAANRLRVRTESHLLIVEAERETSAAGLIDPLISTRAHGGLRCRIVLGDRCDVDHIDASLASGVLSIVVPLVASPAARPVIVDDGERKSSERAVFADSSGEPARPLVHSV